MPIRTYQTYPNVLLNLLLVVLIQLRLLLLVVLEEHLLLQLLLLLQLQNLLAKLLQGATSCLGRRWRRGLLLLTTESYGRRAAGMFRGRSLAEEAGDGVRGQRRRVGHSMRWTGLLLLLLLLLK